MWIPRSLINPGLTIGFVNIHYPVVTGFLILHLAQHGGGGRTAFSAYALMVLLSRFFLGGLPDRLRPEITFYTGLGAMAVGTTIIAFVVKAVVGLRPSEEVETAGLDLNEHGEEGYHAAGQL